MLSTVLLFSIDTTVTAVIQPQIARRFGSVNKLARISVSYLCGSASTNLTWGQLYGQFAAKWLYIASVCIFEVGSAMCAAAPTMNALIVGRAICGLGGAGSYTGVMVLLAMTTAPYERALYFSLCAVPWGIGTVIGPVVGGAFAASSATWRWAFYLNLCVGGIIAPILLFLVPRSDPHKDTTIIQRLRKVDWVGTILTSGTLVTLLMGISFGGTLYAWNSGAVIALFVISGALAKVFLLQQSWQIGRASGPPLFPLELLRSKLVIVMIVVTACVTAAHYVCVYYILLYFQLVRQDGPLQAGVRWLPYIVICTFFIILNGQVMSRYSYYVPWYIFSGIAVTAGSALLYTINDETSVAAIYGYSVLIVAGAGAYTQLSFTVTQNKVDKAYARLAIALLTFARVTALAITLAVSTAVFLNIYKTSWGDMGLVTSRSEIENAIINPSNLDLPGGGSISDTRIVSAIIDALYTVLLLCETAGAMIVVGCLFLKMERAISKKNSG